jgi:RHS repeat-associated protein
VSQGAPLSRVEIELDGQYVGLATLGISRPDVVAVYNRPDFLNSGWSFTGTVTNVDPGMHSITARAYTQSGGSFLVPLIEQNEAIIVTGTMPPLPGNGASTPAGYSFALDYTPNGNVLDAADTVNGSWSYTYDSLNRLTAALSTTTNLNWIYDSFGNRLAQSATRGSAPQISAGFSTNTNRADMVCYDAAGNVLDDGVCPEYGAPKYGYDAEGRMISANFGVTTYLYDAEGKRVAKANAGTLSNVYFYDVDGHLVTETDGLGNELHSDVYIGNRHLATYQGGGIYYNHANWLGTEAARSDANGNLCETLSSLPYGDAQQTNGSCNPNNTFYTGKERDAESGLDYFGARYYGSTMGRWMSPDWANNPQAVPYATYANPQSLNLYNYIRNNPLSGVDTDGHWPIFNATDPNTWRNLGNNLKSVGIGLAKVAVNSINLIGGDCSCQAAVQRNTPTLAPSNAMEGATMMVAPLVVPGVSIVVSATAVAPLALETVSTESLLTDLATQAAQNVGSGSGAVYGTLVHSEFSDLIEGLGNQNLFTEQNYLNGVPVDGNLPGSIRIDVGEGTVNAPTAVYDLKTGQATLKPQRIQQIQSHLPNGSNVPVTEIRPQ